MNTKQLTRIALMGSILYVVFRCFSDILYVELITFTILMFAFVFERKEVVLACVLFALLQILLHGIMFWNIAYMVIFPSYAWLFSISKNWLLKYETIIPFYGAIFSFLTGQLVELPFLLIDQTITLFYIFVGMKTSLIQGCLTFLILLFLYKPTYEVLLKIKKQIYEKY